jgi:hypothetical protein
MDLILVALGLMFSLNVTVLSSPLMATTGAAVGVGGVRTMWTGQCFVGAGQGVMRVVVMTPSPSLSSVALVAIVLGALVIKW